MKPTEIVCTKNATFPMILTRFFSYYWVSRHQEAIPLAQRRFKQLLWKLQDRFCNNWVNVENKKFQTKFYLSSEKKLFYIFSRNTEFCRRPKQFYQAPQSIQAILVQVNRSILKDLISCWKQNILKIKTKRQTFQWKKKLCSSCITEYDNPQKTFYKGPRGLLTFIVQLIKYKIVSVRVR